MVIAGGGSLFRHKLRLSVFVHVDAQCCTKQGSSREKSSCVPAKPGFEAVLC